MEAADAGAIGNGSGQLGEFLAEELDAAEVGDSAVLLVVGAIEIAAAALGDLDDGVVVFLRDAGDEVVDAAGPDLKAGIGQGGPSVGISAWKRVYGSRAVVSSSISVPKLAPAPGFAAPPASDTMRRV